MKFFIVAGLLFGLVGVPSAALSTGIPVFDGANVAQSIQQIMHMVEQIKHVKNQLEVAESMRQKMSAVRDMAGIIDSVYDNDMDVDFADILEESGIKSAADLGLTGDVADIYNEKTRNTAERKGRSDKYMKQTIDRFQELKKLVEKVNAAPDPKDIMDLQARIQGEEVLLQNELLKLEMMQSQAKAEQEVNDQKALQIYMRMANKPATDW